MVERIHTIATGEVPLTHDGIDGLAFSNGREHLRELLIAHGILPARHRHLAAFERWAATRAWPASAIPATGDSSPPISVGTTDPDSPGWRRRVELTESRYAVTRAQTNIAVRLLCLAP